MIFSKNTQVEWLMSHSYGQGGTVALPFSDDKIEVPIEGDYPAGVQDVLNRLADHYIDWPKGKDKDVEWCFLVGGPGNGKSEALRSLADLVNIDLPQRSPGQSSPRTVPREWPTTSACIPGVPGINLVFINDASIPRSGIISLGRAGSLFFDISDGIKANVEGNGDVLAFFGNINRGILVEEEAFLLEKSSLYSDDISTFSIQIIQWLAHPPKEKGEDPGPGIETIVPITALTPYYGQFRIPITNIGGRHSILVHVIFLDSLSLLEPKPGGNHDKAIDFSSSPPKVNNYVTFGGFSDERSATRENTVAGKLLSLIVRDSLWEGSNSGCKIGDEICSAYDYCPFVQNAKWLRDIDLQRKFLDGMRAAEIASARRFTYRDLVGHLSLALIGKLERSWVSTMTHPCEWVKQKYTKMRESDSEAVIAELVVHRIYTNIFPSPDPDAWKTEAIPSENGSVYKVVIDQMTFFEGALRNRSFEEAFGQIDPARSVDSWPDFSRDKVIESVEAIEIKKPTLTLKDQGVLSQNAISDIETTLDNIVREEIAKELFASTSKLSRTLRENASRRAIILRKWRNTLLLRQVGLSRGWINLREVIAAWLSEQYNALMDEPILELGRGVRYLLFPVISDDDSLILAPLRPRISNLDRDNLPPNTMLVKITSSNLKLNILPKGDNLVAEILQVTRNNRIDNVKVSIIIDLPIAREALLRSRAGANSFTEIGSSAFARIERVRASLVGKESLRQGSVYFTDDFGKLYRIVRDVTGKAQQTIMREN
jgi:hypothetical protein